MRVKKTSADPEAAGSPYSLEGAEYTLYDSEGKAAGTLRTGKDGISNELTVLCGKYTLKETKASPGFELDAKTYDLTVPNSAVREDNNGKFILIVSSKESPLGNRYIATRVDVQVLDSDDLLTAITGSLSGYEYVITTATKPVAAGMQVRLAEDVQQ